ncbi:ribbon-helix-helix domain-containing protein [Laspinema olomoucense]|uniref:ribbon-helix-helix domain-containing protein n=1 Tax=Laspinema olomoucense TaxID=3231600 RepID=UPI0021BAA45C|nr:MULTISPECIES: type II toxin-antitoxin system ParD family antitoxin [unclassified Laspinema]MCT7971654.1 type II toxin-antitoxin system ParD family antitoxin [Laspinema sp. D3d]MCT7992905.1 type II toxin-antitoxin system ParD family antitoxin [Laspinema sp. D3c]
MTISLNPEQEQFIKQKLNSGKYATVDEILTEAFRLLGERDRQYDDWVKTTQAKLETGLAQLDKGEGIDGKVVMTQLREKSRTLREEGHH